MNYEQIQEIIKTMIDSNLTALELQVEGVTLKLRKDVKEEKEVPLGETGKKEVQPAKETYIKNAEVEKPAQVHEIKPEKVNEAIESGNSKVITSPMVGTFYASAGPEKDNFVSVGTKIKKGQVLCIIEAMKLMNEIDSEVNGEIVEILAENEQMVEYGQPLFKVNVEG